MTATVLPQFTYEMRLAEMLIAAKLNPDSSIKRIWVQGEGKVSLPQLYVVDKHLRSAEEVEEEFNRLGFAPANIAQFLLFVATYPEEVLAGGFFTFNPIPQIWEVGSGHHPGFYYDLYSVQTLKKDPGKSEITLSGWQILNFTPGVRIVVRKK